MGAAEATTISPFVANIRPAIDRHRELDAVIHGERLHGLIARIPRTNR